MKFPRLDAGPLRWLYLATFLTATGSGGWFVCWTIFAVTSIGLSTWEFGTGVTIAGVVGLTVSAPLGYLADRIGVKPMLLLLVATQGLAVLSFALVTGFWSFVAVSCFLVLAERSVPPLRIALVCGLTEEHERLRHLSSLRVVQSGGASLGAGVGTLVLFFSTRPAFLALLFLYGGFTLCSMLVIRRLPAVPSLRERGQKRRAMVVRDRPFLLATLLFGVLALNWGVLAVGVPLWVVSHTTAPAWTVGVMLALNTIGIMAFQKRASAASNTVSGAGRSAMLSVLPLVAACLLFASTAGRSGTPVLLVLILAALVHTVGELLFVASSWGVAVGLTPQEAHGEYQGVFNSGFTVAEMVAPVVMSALVVGWGTPGWFALAGLFVLAGLPMGRVVAWALRHPLRSRPDLVPTGAQA
ncbi:MFS transporter [Micromonospora sp. NPDC048170]|uniref:MFS transporter n=1 Tax=Micromonospora sp. NPDC048170 TaxID=3154819 RepID=UPI0033DD5615